MLASAYLYVLQFEAGVLIEGIFSHCELICDFYSKNRSYMEFTDLRKFKFL